MTTSSNLYANAIFAEHPIAIYALDDDVRYISLISDSQRYFESGGWSASVDNSASASFNDSPEIPELASPFKNDIYTQISASNVVSDDTTITWESPELFSFSELNQDLATFAIAFYLYQTSFFVNWYEVGYVYYDNLLSQDVEVVNRVESQEGESWINFDFSFLPNEYDSNNVRIIIKINVDAGGSEEDYRFIVNGITVGQWSETSSTESLGVTPEDNSLGYSSAIAYEYGVQENSGYYIVENNKLLAVNEGLPLVYGSKNCTRLYPSQNNDKPSLIFPGRGFLNDLGRFNEYTIEFWMNIDPNTYETIKIFGTLDTDDGIYVNNAFLSIKLGNNFASHSVSEWYRPMLIHFSVSEDIASLLVNGEQVISIPFDRENFNFNSAQDWVGFYTHSDIENFSIDCVSFYSYTVPLQVAKRRFVYGQGTDAPEVVADSFDGKGAYINYSNANYNINKIYPDTANWEGGYSNNLNKTRASLSLPEYSLPEIYIGGRNIDSLYEDNKIVNELEGDKFFTFRPHVSNNKFVTDGTKWTEPGYIFFDSLGIIESLSSIYGVFSTKKLDQTSTLMLITKSDTNDRLHVYLSNGTIYYDFNGSTIHSELIDEIYYDEYNYNFYSQYQFQYDYSYSQGYYFSEILGWEYSFAFGLNIKNFINSFGYSLKRFFQSPNNLQAYFGGDGANTFEGKIHSIGFSNPTNLSEISNLFNSNGIVDHLEYETLSNHFATYTLGPLIRFNKYFLDISVSSLWEEYFPLSIFAGYVEDINGDKFYDIDFLQVNLGYPSIYEVVQKLITRFSWSYIELFSDFNFPSQKGYDILNNENLSGYETYEDLTIKNELKTFLDTTNSSLRSYVTFQLLSEGANEPLSSFPYTRDLYESKILDATLENDPENPKRPYLTKFEFVDKTVIYPPKYFDFENVAAVFHFVFKHEGILSNPLYVRDFEIVSRALNLNDFNKLGSESGVPIYPYTKSGIYYEHKTKNPMLISKKRSPYLYLTEDSGVSLLGDQTTEKEHGISIPINQEALPDYEVNAIQLWMKYDRRSFPLTEYPIFEIQSLNKTIEFIIKTDASGKRGMITARNKSNRFLEEGVVFYQNGIRVKSPTLEFNQWNSIGVSLKEEMIFNEYVGYINIFRGATFNNITHYKTSGLGKTLELITRPWRRVLTENDVDNITWASWYAGENTETRTRTNVAFNPSLESNTDGWAANGAGTIIERTSEDSRFGNYSLKCTTASADNSGVLFGNTSGQRMAITPDTQYTVSIYVKIPEGSPDKTLRLRIRQYEQVSGGSALPVEDQQDVLFTDQDGWTRLFYTFVSDSSANALGIEVGQATGNQNGSMFLLDALLVEDTSSLFPQLNRYFDGNVAAPGTFFESLVWNGTENNSTSTGTYYVISENNIRQWVNVYAISEDVSFALTPADIYKAFVGLNGFVIDDGTSLVIDADSMNMLSGLRWSRYSDTPA